MLALPLFCAIDSRFRMILSRVWKRKTVLQTLYANIILAESMLSQLFVSQKNYKYLPNGSLYRIRIG